MSVIDLVVEKVKALPEDQARAVLAFIHELSESPAPSARDLIQLAPAERRQILLKQAAKAEVLYRSAPEIVTEDAEGPLSHG